MIQLATDPHAHRPSYRPAAGDGKDAAFEFKRAPRTGHAWPFISRSAGRLEPQAAPSTPRSDSGS